MYALMVHRQRMPVARELVITNYEAIIILVKCVVIIDNWELATFWSRCEGRNRCKYNLG